MFKIGLNKLKEKKLSLFSFFTVFLIINSIIDYLNVGYPQMAANYGIFLVIVNITVNIIMSGLTSLMLTLSLINLELKGTETKSQNLGFLSVIFGIMTYGCTSCVIGFFAAVGISYSVVALPLAGLPYKMISLIIIIFGLMFTRYEMNKPCAIKFNNQ